MRGVEKIVRKYTTYLLGTCCLLILILSFYIIQKGINKNNVQIDIGGIKKTINIKGKNFQEICSATSGLWMAKDMGMSELRNGISASIEKCSGCMPDSKNMFCKLDDYIAYVKEKGVKPQELNKEMKK